MLSCWLERKVKNTRLCLEEVAYPALQFLVNKAEQVSMRLRVPAMCPYVEQNWSLN
jgi:hypothetical protein